MVRGFTGKKMPQEVFLVQSKTVKPKVDQMEVNKPMITKVL